MSDGFRLRTRVLALGGLALALVAIQGGRIALASKPAARMGDYQTCPAIRPPSIPHVGGHVLKGAYTVLIGGKPAARLSDSCSCAGPPSAITSV